MLFRSGHASKIINDRPIFPKPLPHANLPSWNLLRAENADGSCPENVVNDIIKERCCVPEDVHGAADSCY